MALKLEVFETDGRPKRAETVVLDLSALDEAKLASFDTGYRAGWDDAAAAQAGDQSKISADLGRNLQSLGFTYQEARAHVLKAVEPLLLEIVGKLLPELARASLAPMILETLTPLAEGLADAPVTLVLNPAARPAVEALLEQTTGLPLTLVEEPTLGEGQAWLRLGASETHVDLDAATEKIAAAVRSFFDLPGKD
jgi:flagellar biosynthesis/type III secretory pathway protein FliH